MKIKYPIIAFILLQIIAAIGEHLELSGNMEFMIQDIIGILDLTLIGLIIYLLIRNLFRKIKSAAANISKKNQQTERPPWEL